MTALIYDDETVWRLVRDREQYRETAAHCDRLRAECDREIIELAGDSGQFEVGTYRVLVFRDGSGNKVVRVRRVSDD